MTKESGMGMAVAVDDDGGNARTISNDITNLSWGTPRGVQDVTGLDKSAMERLLLLADFSCDLNGVFNDADDMSFDVFKSLCSTSVIRTVTITISAKVLAAEARFSAFTMVRAQSGEHTWTANGQLGNGTAAAWA
jgi:hypothetical protein